ncbi:hypothetical protein F5Y03DRAFT_407240 [Xylaria venustula]|nr:hypothetical protein F5Y03DRAFT_407240 [Xylaria venustula]
MDQNTILELYKNGNDIEDVLRNQARLAQYFAQDEGNRFEMEGVISSGYYGLTWKIKYRASARPTNDSSTPHASKLPGTTRSERSFRRIVLKTDRVYSFFGEDAMDVDGDDNDDDDPNPQSQTPNEKMMLRYLRWAKHVVTPIEIPNDPLARRFRGIPSHRMKEDTWLYVEWLENGTISKLIDRAAENGFQFPNRLLWRFFLCLLRMCIAMGWPPVKPEGKNPQPVTEVVNGRPYGGVLHHDMHEGNIMIGDLILQESGCEHTLSPILKLIDLGSMKRVPDTPKHQREAIRDNIFDIGVIMLAFIALDCDLIGSVYASEADATLYQITDRGDPVFTNGSILLINDEDGGRPYPWLDTGLRRLVCACLATDPSHRPSMEVLVNITTSCVSGRDEAFYASRGRDPRTESDQAITTFLSDLVFDAEY